MEARIQLLEKCKAETHTHSKGFLAGIKVHFLASTISNASARTKIWERRLTAAGGQVSKDAADPSVTHVIVGDKPEGLARFKPPAGRARIVMSSWLEDCLSQQSRLGEQKYLVDVHRRLQEVGEEEAQREQQPGPMRKYAKWLGHWKPEYDAVRSENELVLMVSYSEDNDAKIGNGAIVRALIEMEKYWDALDGDFVRDVVEASDDMPQRTEHRVNHHSLSFARAASVVRACAFKIMTNTSPEDLQLPFIGKARAQQICDLATTGTTLELEQHRSNAQVFSSPGPDGKRREYPGAVGSAVRRQFKKLPGVGAQTARRWYELGFRTFEDVEEAARPGGQLAKGGEAPMTVSQAFSLRHRGDLLEKCTRKDVDEMRDVVLETLNNIAGEGWTMEIVGGAARGHSSHDADFVVSNPLESVDGVVNPLYEALVAQGRLFPKAEAMCQIQDHRMPQHLASMREEIERKDKSSFFSLHNLAGDRFDHIFGNYLTKAGKVRRMDIIIAPDEEQALCVLGWTGSRQYLRFLRQYAVDRGMHLNSHRLMRKDESGKAVIVPQEAPPLDRSGNPCYPEGWGPKRRVTHERHIFELLGVQYWPPHQRNAP